VAGVLRRPGAGALTRPTGETLSVLRDDVGLAEETVDSTVDLIGEALFAAVALAILLRVNAVVALCVFLPLAAVVGMAQAATARVERDRAARQQATGRVAGALGEAFGAVQAVQVARAEQRVVAHVRRLGEERRRSSLRERRTTLLLESVHGNTVNLGTGLILLLGAAAVRAGGGGGAGTFTVGDFALFVSYLGFVTEFTAFAGGFLTQVRQVGVSLGRMRSLVPDGPAEALLEPHPVFRPVPLTAPMSPVGGRRDALRTLDVSGLTYRYPESGGGVEGVSLRLERGTVTVVTGPVGAGKTTLLRALLGLLPARAGAVRWNGEPVADPAAFFVPPRSAYTPQVPRLFGDTLRANLLLGLAERPQGLAAAVAAAVLERDLAGLPAGLDTVVGARGVRLSGGQVQRAAAARMFYREPDLLVVDDLSSALDVDTERLLWERLLDRGPGAGRPTVLAVSHRRQALRRADQILVLQAGRVVGIGPLDHLLATCAPLVRLWGAGQPP
jgi:ATP-binding cassette subfamily B protein